MQYLADTAQREYEFWRHRISSPEFGGSFVTLSADDVLKAHFALIDYFDKEGVPLGGIGPRSEALLESTIGRQDVSFGGTSKWENQFEVIATLFFGIIKNHPFHDANKRTALLSCVFHLENIRKCLLPSDKELEEFTVSIAKGRVKEDFGKQRRTVRGADDEVKFIAKWLRRKSRNIDLEYREITYMRLRKILARFNISLDNPKGNKIDVIRARTRRSIRRFGGYITETERVCRVGYHSEKSVVPKVVIKQIREACNLNYANGIDSSVFYHFDDPIYYLIGRYEEPLRNLADR